MRRRELLAAAAVAALSRPAAATAAAAQGDPAILERLIADEEAAALAHRLTGTPYAGHESEHARALRTLLAALGREGPPAPRGAAELDGPARRLAAAGTPAAARALEDALVATYRDALLALAEPSILRTAATILASHVQHRSLAE